EEPLALGVVDPAAAPGIAAKQPPAGEDRPAEEPVMPHRIERVLRAARVVLAAAAPEHAQRPAVGIDQPESRVGGRAQGVPHADAFPRISSTRSLSQSKPRVSAASASPGRTPST